MSYYGGYHYHQEDWDSEYDSTWEEEEEEDEQPKSKKVKTSHQFNQHRRAARDMQNYRHGYPDKSPKPNLLFYQNKIPFEPHGKYIDYIHEQWHDQYDKLERNHNFIQWLFPLREHGVNRCATPLTVSEIELMKADEQVMARILESYKLMLGFYGIVLVDTDTGMVARAEDNWEDRFDNLNNHTHNNLRITRILKCLGEMGYEKFQAPLVSFFLEETLCNGNLPEVKESALEYFMFAVKDKKERQKLVRFAWMNYKPQERFIWGPVDKLRECSLLPPDSESKCEGDGPEDDKLQMITSKNDSSEDYSAVDSEISGNRVGLVRRVQGYTALPFLALFWFVKSPFLVLFRMVFRPARGFFRSYFFWFRGKARNKDGLNEGQISVKTDGTETGAGAEYAEMSNIDGNGQSLTVGSKDNEGLNIGTQNTLLEIDQTELVVEQLQQYGGERDEDENLEISKTDRNRDTRTMGSKDNEGLNIGTQNTLPEIDLTEQVVEQLQQYGGERDEDENLEISKTEGNRDTRTIGSKDNEGLNIGTQNTLPEIDQTEQVVEQLRQYGGERDEDENLEISKTKGNRNTRTMGSEDNEGVNIGTQNTLPEIDQIEQVVEQLQPYGGERDEDENLEISKTEGNRNKRTMGSKDNEGENIRKQNTENGKVKTEQDERVDHTRGEVF